ncbi:hypothetical protein [Subtercola sp. YIM 133946]|uniref:hypothetical protein n=1 Tax=Subtercola sp. YIM 133946 TaxID=3118909 RepID=UPI002F943F6B
MNDNDPLVKQVSGWWLVLAGLAMSILGVGLLVGLSMAHIDMDGTGRAKSIVLFLVPLGVVLLIVGLVAVIRRRPLVDDTAKHADFRRRNRALMAEQRSERRAQRNEGRRSDRK